MQLEAAITLRAGGPGSGRHTTSTYHTPETPYGVRYSMFNKAGQPTVKQKYFSHDEDRAKHVDKMENHPDFHEVVAWDNPHHAS